MKPHVVLHIEVSVDGRIDGFKPHMELFYELIPRWAEEATLAGADTILAAPDAIPEETEDDLKPPETSVDDPRPLLAIPDSRGRVRIWHALRSWPFWGRFVALVSKTTPQEYLDYLAERHVDHIVAGDDHVDMEAALEELNRRYGVSTVRVDSGGTLNGVLLRQGLVDEVSVLHAPALVGGETSSSMFRAPDIATPDGAIELRLEHLGRLREDIVWTRYSVVR
jgi:2,5-diamino-6-(ribosylamino)-4(3H)-pyrimidinone 5'-phosphate reductase